MKIIERYKSFTMAGVEQRAKALANFLAGNPPSTPCSLICMCSPNKKTYRTMFFDKKYWIAHYGIELIRFKNSVILSDESRKFLLDFLDISIKQTPYKKARYKALSQLKYSNLPRIIIYWMLGYRLKYALFNLKAPKELIKSSFILAELFMDLNIQSMHKIGFKRRDQKPFNLLSFLKRIVLRTKKTGDTNDSCNDSPHNSPWHRDIPWRTSI